MKKTKSWNWENKITNDRALRALTLQTTIPEFDSQSKYSETLKNKVSNRYTGSSAATPASSFVQKPEEHPEKIRKSDNNSVNDNYSFLPAKVLKVISVPKRTKTVPGVTIKIGQGYRCKRQNVVRTEDLSSKTILNFGTY